MNYVYKYTDLTDGIIKYVGIVCRKSENALQKRIKEHSESDSWLFEKSWKIEYIEVETKNDANALEAHFIAKYGTDEWYNSSKTKLGILTCINDNFDWKIAEPSLFVEKKSISKQTNDKYKESISLKEMMGRRLHEIEHSLKIINMLLNAKDYSIYPKEQLIADKEELEKTHKALLDYELSRPVIVL